jgi:hypothetical protein
VLRGRSTPTRLATPQEHAGVSGANGAFARN